MLSPPSLEGAIGWKVSHNLKNWLWTSGSLHRPHVLPKLNNLGEQGLRDIVPQFCISKIATQGFWESITVFSPDTDYSLFRRAFLATPNLSENLTYQQNHSTVISNLSVLSKAKVLFCCLSLIMFSEPCHGGSDEILALCARKSHRVCICLTEALISSNMECSNLAMLLLDIFFIFCLNSRQNIIPCT